VSMPTADSIMTDLKRALMSEQIKFLDAMEAMAVEHNSNAVTITGTIEPDSSNPYSPIVRIVSDETGTMECFCDILEKHWFTDGERTHKPRRFKMTLEVKPETETN